MEKNDRNTAWAMGTLDAEVSFILTEMDEITVNDLAVAIMCRLEDYADSQQPHLQDLQNAIDYLCGERVIDYEKYLADVVDKANNKPAESASKGTHEMTTTQTLTANEQIALAEIKVWCGFDYFTANQAVVDYRANVTESQIENLATKGALLSREEFGHVLNSDYARKIDPMALYIAAPTIEGGLKVVSPLS